MTGRQSTLVRAGLRGFDANCPITLRVAKAFFDHGYRYAVRYVPRITRRSHDLSATEVCNLLDAGLGVMAVQHVESAESWTPTVENGTLYGRTAAAEANEVGLLPGCTVWLDLEGVARGTPAQTIINYCNNWYDAVRSKGYEPGMYVGWHCGLNASDLYSKVRFSRYWSAYNLDRYEYPALRGVCMQQHERKAQDIPPGVGFGFDVNTTQQDGLGCLPTMLTSA